MYSKKINQLATNLNPQETDLIPIGDATTGQLKTTTFGSISGITGDGVISGGVVTWSGTGLIFNISACTYILNGIRYTSPASTKTLAASDPTNPRIDVFAVNTSGQVVIIQGTPNVNPVEPQVDVDTQLQLTNVTITAGSTTPTQVTTNMVYNENLPYGGEWVMELGQGTTPSYTIQADYTGYAPYNGTYSWRTTKAFAGSVSLRWAKDPVVNFNVSDYTNLSLAVRITNAITSTDSIKIWFESDTNSVSSNKLSLTTLYGFNPNLLNQWQLVVIPIADFKLLRTQFAKIVLYWNQTSVVSSAMGFDEMKLQGGISNNTNNPVIPPQTGNNGKYLTTNGSTLSWDNAMKIGGSITSATAGSVLFAGTSGVLAQDNSNFFWDDSNNRLGIGTTTPSNKLSIVETTNVAIGFNVTNTTAGTSNSLNMNLVADTTAGYVQFQKRSSTHTATGIANASSGLLYNSEGDLIIGTGGATSWIRFATNGITTADMNLTANGRLLLGTSTEGTTLLNVNGTSLLNGFATISGSTTAASAIARGSLVSSTLVADANNDVLVGLDISPTFTNGAFTGVGNYAARFNGTFGSNGISLSINRNLSSNNSLAVLYADNSETSVINTSPTASIRFTLGGVNYGRFFATTGNLLLQNGGTFTDAGYRLDVNGTSRFQDNLSVTKNGNFPTRIDITNTTSAANSVSLIGVNSDTLAGGAYFGKYSTNATPYKTLLGKDFVLYNVYGDISFLNDINGGRIKFTTQGRSVADVTLTIAGRLLIGTTTENTSALLNVTSTTQGFLPPRMTTTQKNAIATPAAGLIVYDTTTNKLCCYNGTTWNDLF